MDMNDIAKTNRNFREIPPGQVHRPARKLPTVLTPIHPLEATHVLKTYDLGSPRERMPERNLDQHFWFNWEAEQELSTKASFKSERPAVPLFNELPRPQTVAEQPRQGQKCNTARSHLSPLPVQPIIRPGFQTARPSVYSAHTPTLPPPNFPWTIGVPEYTFRHTQFDDGGKTAPLVRQYSRVAFLAGFP
eukprot:CAMPEP_0119328964 /NCGR_PEP_ID=MMETSP1333-20130426/74668_1 /TAXON_ID=418940 /ORGANISM="Scyphosphaera apsteinii, Strain RCC1455" /LENGTH=189 /DNA_ID=CAMNT_0007337963 /DNA_START=71 /DNA_END=640 /DNA_ORIENTATION=+